MDDELPQEEIQADKSVLPEEPEEIVSEDGKTTTLLIPGNSSNKANPEWFANLAESLDDAVLDGLAISYLDLITQDIEARKDRDKMQEEGLKKAGLGSPAPGGADFEGASRATHPVLIEAYIDFAASSIKELFPPNGPVRAKVEGKPNKEKMDRAKRKSEFMNWELMQGIKAYRPELERLLTQLPVGGSQYMKLYWDDAKMHPNVEFIPIDDMVLPYEAKNFFDLQRKFHKMQVTDFEYARRVASKLYRDMSLPTSYLSSEFETDTAKQINKIEGKKQDYSSETGQRIIFEGCVYEAIDEDDSAPEGKACPYIITIDDQSRKVLSIYRNWSEDDETAQELEYIVDFNFIPWRGVFALSLLQCLAGLPDALTGSLRALLDSALISNMQGGLKLKGNPGGASLSISPTQVTEVDAMGQDDIRKIYMPIPFNPPSPVLFQLLGFMTQAAQGVVSTAEEKIADASNNMPMGTALALIEQGAKVFSSIHARLHDSQKRCLEILHRLFRDHLPDKLQFGSDPDDYVTRQDFEGSMDVHPVSDPNIFSETQRFAQIQFVMQSITQTAAVVPQVVQLFDLRALYARAFELAKIPDYEEFLPATPEAVPTNPVDENVNMVMGKPVKAFAGQNHEAHIQVLLDFAQNPLFGSSPIIAQKFGPSALNHLQDHLLVWYEEMMKADAAMSLGKDKALIDWDDDASSSIAMAKSAPVVDKASTIAFAKIPDLIAAGMKKLQEMMPKPPIDPMVAVAQADVQGRHQIAQSQLSLDQQKIQSEAQSKMIITQQKADQARQDYEIAMKKIGVDAGVSIRTANIKAQTDMAKAVHDHHSTKDIAKMHIKAEQEKPKDNNSTT